MNGCIFVCKHKQNTQTQLKKLFSDGAAQPLKSVLPIEIVFSCLANHQKILITEFNNRGKINLSAIVRNCHLILFRNGHLLFEKKICNINLQTVTGTNLFCNRVTIEVEPVSNPVLFYQNQILVLEGCLGNKKKFD